jgi:hypothetical protein
MNLNTYKTMGFILGAVYDFCTDNKADIARFRIDISGSNPVIMAVTIEERMGRAHSFLFSSEDDFRLDCTFDDFRDYAADFLRKRKK